MFFSVMSGQLDDISTRQRVKSANSTSSTKRQVPKNDTAVENFSAENDIGNSWNTKAAQKMKS